MEKFALGFDFSINKPAMTVCHNGVYSFYIWPLDMKDKLVDLYAQCKVKVNNRGLSSVSKKSMDENLLTYTHTRRSIDLANMIVDTIKDLVSGVDDYELYVCSEGLSFNSTGDASLNLATYKGVMLAKLMEVFGDKIKILDTYAPLTIKSTAGCAGKAYHGDKNAMIKMFMDNGCDALFRTALIEGHFDAGKNYKQCVDDIVDSYWAVMTMFKKRGDLLD